jgi:triosephosphate isomerase
MRTPLIAGNWKMNHLLAASRELVATIRAGVERLGRRATNVEIAICPPATYLFPIAKAVAGSPIAFGAQNVSHEPAGAFTGELAPSMIAETGARYVIVGHSERRHTIGLHEDDWIINRKAKAAQAAKLTPILCVGETLAQRDANQTLEVLTFQLTAGLTGLRVENAADLVIAYEPVWAIGTGRNATAAQAQEAHAHLRAVLAMAAGSAAGSIRILYGGSVKPENAREILAQPDVDGGLIGGASLKADSFLAIIESALAAKG